MNPNFNDNMMMNNMMMPNFENINQDNKNLILDLIDQNERT